MATKDNTPGLFSRVASFVRSPVAGAPDGEAVTPSQQPENSAQAIKRVLERKAHNDAIRKREFARLRKLKLASSEEAVKIVARESFFMDSSHFPVLQERASTLKKIDEIEAQMSKQWWKNRQDTTPSAAPSSSPTRDAPILPEDELSEEDTRASFAATVPADLNLAGQIGPTLPGDVPSINLTDPLTRHEPVPSRMFELTGNSAFSNSKMVSIEMGETLSDPTLEDAAIRFANGDDAGAEAVLLEALQSASAQSPATDTWASALFDLYRGTGQQDRFDRFALDYAERFDRTAPIWYSTPALLRGEAGSEPVAGAAKPRASAWACPAELDEAAAQALGHVLRSGAGPLYLDWRRLESVHASALTLVAELLALCCDRPLLLQLEGEEVLGTLLRQRTPVGNNRVDPAWWKVRLDMLRMLGQQNEFELVAMDYCITYEVSPPSWQPAKCLRHTGAKSTDQINTFAATLLDTLEGIGVALDGELKGDVTERLKGLQQQSTAADALQINCEHLIRVDFAAAGSILNWVTTCHQRGRQIEFFQAPRLVAAFFSLVGIHEHARITVRAN